MTIEKLVALPRLTAIAERTEAENMIRLHEHAPAHVKEALGMATARIGGGVACSMRYDPTGGYWSKALGYGIDRPVDADLIAEIAEFYRKQDSRQATLQIAPALLPADWDEIRRANAITGGGWWVKLLCEADYFTPGRTDLRIAPVEPEQQLDAAGLLMRGFGMPAADLVEMFAATSARDDILAFAAWDGDKMVAVSSLFFYGDSAEFAGTATLPEHRGRGAQSALLAARAAAAVERGVNWFVVETGRPDPGEVNHSYNNLLRSGFAPLYERRNWIWKPAA